MTAQCSICYIPNFVEIGSLVPERKILRGFTIYGLGSHLGHVTRKQIPIGLHIKFGFDLPSGFGGKDV